MAARPTLQSKCNLRPGQVIPVGSFEPIKNKKIVNFWSSSHVKEKEKKHEKKIKKKMN